MNETTVEVTGSNGSKWLGQMHRLPFGQLAQIDDESMSNPTDPKEHAVSFETDMMVWDIS